MASAPAVSLVDEASFPLETLVGGESDINQFDILPLHLLDLNDVEYMQVRRASIDASSSNFWWRAEDLEPNMQS